MSRTASSAHSRVPTTRDVVPGARVNIVLKADQPTGRTVSGTVKDVLTRGDHHRGIKVRLVDGRIGRVQTLAASDGQSSEEAAEAGVPPESETSFTPRGRRGQHRGQNRSEPEEPPAQQIGLDAYVKQKKPRGKGARRSATEEAPEPTSNEATTSSAENSEMVICPVCGSFTGDEAAVAHHVASHFD